MQRARRVCPKTVAIRAVSVGRVSPRTTFVPGPAQRFCRQGADSAKATSSVRALPDDAGAGKISAGAEF
jgi:hypothetical protein